MVHLHIVDEQLREIGLPIRFFNRPEVRELAKILSPDETVAQAVNGYYEGGFALLVVTDHRLLLIDRKPMFLTLEDIRFDMVSEVDFNYRLLNAMIRVYTPNKSLVFTSWNHHRLRELTEYLQHQVLRSRQQLQQQPYMTHEQFTQFAQAQLQTAAAMQPTQQRRRFPASLLPALASTAFQGANEEDMIRPAITRFVSPLPRNPYTKSPLLSRRRKYPFM